MLSGLDWGIIIVYFIMVTAVGLYASKKAAGSVEEYFLGGRNIPWFILGISGMATYIDMSGTMLQTSFFYIFGVKGYWITFRGAVALSLAFLMIFMGKWLNRSRVMTNAELMGFRFGSGRQGEVARLLSACSILIMVVALVAYFFVGSGKFLALYIPGLSPEVCALMFFGVAMIYTVAAGFYGVVYTDLFQSFLILGVIIFISVKAMTTGTPEFYEKFTDPEWRTLMLSSWKIATPAGYESMKFLGLLIVFWIASNIFQGFGVPHDAWTSQRYYAAKNERESSLVACQWIVMFSFRFLLMMGVGVLAMGIAEKISEPELALPAVINHCLPIGMKGLFIAALIAAAMSSLDSCVNSSAVYFVKDIYQRYLVPAANARHLIKVSYIATAVIMILGVWIGWNVPNINSIWGWVCMGLFTGLLPPNILKWFWWRLNGLGYAFGMGAGLLSAVLQQLIFSGASEYTIFSFIIVISTIGTIIGTFLGKPTEMDVLVKFYKRIKPFGFWKPVREICDPDFVAETKKENKRDILLLGPACLWQLSIFWMLTALVVKKWYSFGGSVILVAVLSMILYKYWYKNLPRTNPDSD